MSTSKTVGDRSAGGVPELLAAFSGLALAFGVWSLIEALRAGGELSGGWTFGAAAGLGTGFWLAISALIVVLRTSTSN